MSFFLPLKKDRNFRLIYNKGKSLATKHLVIFKLKYNEDRKPHIGFVVSKKVGKAVLRNKYKRIVREATKRCDEFDGYDLIIMARPKIVVADYHTIYKDIIFLLKRLKILR